MMKDSSLQPATNGQQETAYAANHLTPHTVSSAKQLTPIGKIPITPPFYGIEGGHIEKTITFH